MHKWSMVLHACNPSLQEVEEGGSQVQDQPQLHSPLKVVCAKWDPIERERKRNKGRKRKMERGSKGERKRWSYLGRQHHHPTEHLPSMEITWLRLLRINVECDYVSSLKDPSLWWLFITLQHNVINSARTQREETQALALEAVITEQPCCAWTLNMVMIIKSFIPHLSGGTARNPLYWLLWSLRMSYSLRGFCPSSREGMAGQLSACGRGNSHYDGPESGEISRNRRGGHDLERPALSILLLRADLLSSRFGHHLNSINLWSARAQTLSP